MGRVQVLCILPGVLDDEIIVKDGVVAFQLQLEAPAVTEEVQPDFVFVLREGAFVSEMLRMDRLRLIMELFVVIHVIT